MAQRLSSKVSKNAFSMTTRNFHLHCFNCFNRSNGWIDCWSVSIVAIKINWIYHLIPPLGPDPQADITTPEKEEILLSPIRMPKLKSPALKWTQHDSSQFDPNTLPPDKVNVEIEIGSSVLFAYGTILRNFINLKVSGFDGHILFDISSKMFTSPIGKYIWRRSGVH